MRVSFPLVVLPAVLGLALVVAPPDARAAGESLLLIEADSGKVLKAENATHPWYPASVTKLMTAYVTLRAVKEGRITLDTVFTVSPNALAQQPTKMGFATGTQVTVDNALKMMMVKSANDIAVVLAEGVSGSIDGFADEMNAASARLGMTQSSWVNPNGLPADGQITSARDMAILARALLREFPEYEGYWNIAAIRFGKRIIRNTNALLVRYPGADGMKTGFICASGFNVVASATRDNRRLIAVVFGAPSSAVRAAKAAFLFENAFNNTGLNWLMPAYGNVQSLPPIAADPPNLREEMCGKHRRRPAAEEVDEEEVAGMPAGTGEPGGVQALFFAGNKTAGAKASSLVAQTIAAGPPIDVYVGLPRKPGTALASTGPARLVTPPGKPDAGSAAIATATKPAGLRKPAPSGLVALPNRGPTAGAVPVPAAKPAVAKPKASVATAPAAAGATAEKPKPSSGIAKPAAGPKPAAAKPPAAKPAAATAKPPAPAAKPAATAAAKPTAAAAKPVPAATAQ